MRSAKLPEASRRHQSQARLAGENAKSPLVKEDGRRRGARADRRSGASGVRRRSRPPRAAHRPVPPPASRHCAFRTGACPLSVSIGGAGHCAIRSSSPRSEEHTSELQSHVNLVCRLLLEKKKKTARVGVSSSEYKN